MSLVDMAADDLSCSDFSSDNVTSSDFEEVDELWKYLPFVCVFSEDSARTSRNDSPLP